MSRFSHANFNAKNYAEARPTYVPKIYDLISNFHKGARDAVVDVGSGPGNGTQGLLDLDFGKVYAVEPSTVMIEEGKNRPRGTEIDWFTGSGENLSQILPNKVDMITSFEAAHWMDHEKTWKECYEVLTPGGTVAHVMYGHTELLGNEKASEIVLDFARNKLKAYYMPQHDIAFGLMDAIDPPSWATRVERHKFLTKSKDGENQCIMTRETTLRGLQAQIYSWSPTDQYVEEHPGEDPVGDIMKVIMELYNAKDLDHPITMAWSLAVFLVSK
ncbi:S-adenosyl-L-methionine-dependent methyltransferase [Wallemia mellicola CBS 633.66]|uniref:S-adenosyl-L-methionine-dependent methyltransferase n=1 Tax=Wallemia mellicola (strain ATCC MYA-4683 / CBS 633.66) TaxID=671144 RepID=I4YIB6_WALMC|nr:S-adenosyl-L-methionine-dependent methyltransferase [Wallemia mellicola CBS 633.66]EIM23708.1 S-adenosyl-L-methionine-dependent methyltransferase [Wallemia mellicola CBS 633.66]|eukprot:XP_006956373.1 S-adenosyl-L-methionine-dependent methyltransferase [Wallemia mellicola CBS 633.66]